MPQVNAEQPILVEIDGQSWAGHVENIEAWLGNVLMAQTTFRMLAEDVHPMLHEPHVKDYVREVAEAARRHEAQAEGLYRMIGRDPAAGKKAAGAGMAALRRNLAAVLGQSGGVPSPWREFHQLFLASLNAQSAFAVAEQLALAVGLKEMAEAAFAVENEQAKYHLLLQELLLETASLAILYKASV